MNNALNRFNFVELASYLLISVAILGMFLMKLVPMVFTGFIVFLVALSFYNLLSAKTQFAKWIVLASVVSVTLLVLSFIGFVIYWGFRSGSDHIRSEGFDGLWTNLANIIEKLRDYLPAWMGDFIPSGTGTLKLRAADLLRDKGHNLLEITDHSIRFFAKFIIGILLGIIISFSAMSHKGDKLNPLAEALLLRVSGFYHVFCQVVTAQVKISLLNTAFTGIFLLLALPLFGVHLPYSKTIVILTFVVGLLPVVGNLITNSIIVLISLTISFPVALASLGFLIGVHKFEYFLNAKIVGHEIKTTIWEILISMVIMEHIFGIAGVVTAPILYGYIKHELVEKELV